MNEVTAANGITYTVKFEGQNLEIQRPDAFTGLQKVFVFKNFSVGNWISKRKEIIVYSYLIANDQRIGEEQVRLVDTPEEFEAFLLTPLWEMIQEQIFDDFLRKLEGTTRTEP